MTNMTAMPDVTCITEKELVQTAKQFTTNLFSWKALEVTRSPLNRFTKAAVLIPLFITGGEIHVWLTLRSANLRNDPGDVAFPGGKRDSDDVDEVSTCLREAEEEIGMHASDVQPIGLLPPRVSRHGILVSPVIGLVKTDTFKPDINTKEVQLAFHLPLRRFLSSERFRTVSMERHGKQFEMPFFDDDFEGQCVTTWGLTAAMCVDVAIGMCGKEPEFKSRFDRFFDNDEDRTKIPFAYQIRYLNDLAARLKTGDAKL